MSSNILEEVMSACADLIECLAQVTDPYEKDQLVINHVEEFRAKKLKITDFKDGLEWFNVSKPLSLAKELKGKVVVLDFFTYCCINCMHVITDLHLLETKISRDEGLVVVGVHSAKFDNEKDSANIISALQRHDITHPVVNDPEGIMWKELDVTCWPTLVILGMDGEVLFVLVGEGHREELLLFATGAMHHYEFNQELNYIPLPLSKATHLLPHGTGWLQFPGKVACCGGNNNGEEERLAIADTGNHRIFVTTTSGIVRFTAGARRPGFVDGSLTEARFCSPQGLVFHTPNLIYVADTGNHAVREINLETGQVRTLVGTGQQVVDKVGGGRWTEQAIASPWDLCLVPAAGPKQPLSRNEVLLIAAAGSHQIWALFLGDAAWWKEKQYESGTCIAVAGSGNEENRNNAYPSKAGFAQPSGLTFAPSQQAVFIADSESSSVRKLSLVDGKVSAVVGGDRDPMNLFCFGDVDGKGTEARLQHPLGVAWSEGKVYVADSYNHRVKVVDPVGNTCSSLLGSGHQGDGCGAFAATQVNEPGGLCASADGSKLYLADTNNHCIKVIHLNEDRVDKLRVELPQEDRTDLSAEAGDPVLLVTAALSPEGGSVIVLLDVHLDRGLAFTPSAPQRWKLHLPSEQWSTDSHTGDASIETRVTVQAPRSEVGNSDTLHFDVKVYVCVGGSLCSARNLRLSLCLVRKDNASRDVKHRLSYAVG